MIKLNSEAQFNQNYLLTDINRNIFPNSFGKPASFTISPAEKQYSTQWLNLHGVCIIAKNP